MRDAGVDRDDQIQLRYQRRGIGKILKRVAVVKNIGTISEQGGILGANVLLQADKGDIGTNAVQQWYEGTQTDRPFPVSFVPGVARPDQANPGVRFSLQARLPCRHMLRGRG